MMNVEGRTAIHCAVLNGLQTGHGEALELTLKALCSNRYGAEAVNFLDNEGRTALHYAISLKKTDAVFSLSQVADVNIPDTEGRTPLHYAANLMLDMYMDILMRQEANLSLCDSEGNTALILVCIINTAEDTRQLSLIFLLFKHCIAYGAV